MQTGKGLFKKNEYPYITLLAYRATPFKGGYSSSELLMSRRLRTTVPVIQQLLIPQVPDVVSVRESQKASKVKMKKDYDHCHAARDLPELKPGDAVWIPEFKETGRVLDEVQPRSYMVQTSTRVIQRNRQQMSLTEASIAIRASRVPRKRRNRSLPDSRRVYTRNTSGSHRSRSRR